MYASGFHFGANGVPAAHGGFEIFADHPYWWTSSVRYIGCGGLKNAINMDGVEAVAEVGQGG